MALATVLRHLVQPGLPRDAGQWVRTFASSPLIISVFLGVFLPGFISICRAANLGQPPFLAQPPVLRHVSIG